MNNEKFKFKKNDRIGSTAAEDDLDFLESCFIDDGSVNIIQDINDNRQIVVGRTGSGKSALLWHLKNIRKNKVIELNPDELALTYTANSDILNFFSGININLDPFFKLLWRHIFVVEILKKHMDLYGNEQKVNLFDKLSAFFSGSSKSNKEAQKAIDYLKTWGEKFWLETEYRVKEITSKLEEDFKNELNAGGKFGLLSTGLSLESMEKLSEQQKTEVVNRAQKVVSKAQIKDLSQVLKLLDSVLADRQKQYYVIIDRLDENWMEDRLRYKLIMSLIVTARDFSRVKNAKIIIAMRRDLLDRVFRLTRDSGFQEEKYKSLYLPLTWDNRNLLKLLDLRINNLVRMRYTKQPVKYYELLPKKLKKKSIVEFLFERAAQPREVIAFFNIIINTAQNCSRITVDHIRKAEGEYSRTRLRALGDEWNADYPHLLEYVDILRKRPASFKLEKVSPSDIEELCLNLAVQENSRHNALDGLAHKVIEDSTRVPEFKNNLFRVFYRVGLIGLKLQAFESASWVDELGQSVSAAEINDSVSAVVHPRYYRALGIKVIS